MMISSNELNFRIPDEIRDALDDYALRQYRKSGGKGNRSEAARQIIQAILNLGDNEQVKEIINEDLVFNDDILVFVRTAVSFYLSNRLRDEAEHSLQ